MGDFFYYVIFFLTATSIVFSVHYYLWHRLVKKTLILNRLKKIATATIVVLAIFIPVNFILLKLHSLYVLYPFSWVIFLWLGLMFFLFFWVLFADLFLLVVYVLKRIKQPIKAPINQKRRVFIARAVATNALVLSSGMAAVSVKNYYSEPIIKDVAIKINNLPNSFKNFKIAQLSDLHLGQLMDKTRLREVVQITNSIKPDLVAITGDMVDGRVNVLKDDITPLQELKSRFGSYFVVGNHEYYSGVEDWIKEITKQNVKVLENESVKIKKNKDFIYLSGVYDYGAHRVGSTLIADYKKALEGLQKDIPTIMLAHQPKAVKKLKNFSVDLMLSGHTHGGQIWPFNFLVGLVEPHLKGLKRIGNTQVYVNQGTGCWGPPMRLGTFNEITQIRLV
jgi:uncharacterized protein